MDTLSSTSRPSAEDRELLDDDQAAAQAPRDWRMLVGALHARYRLPSYPVGLALVAEIGRAAEQADHHPELTLTHGHLALRLRSHDVDGVTRRDLRLAAQVSRLAAEYGAAPDPGSVATLELALDTPDRERVLPFWEAVLGYRGNGDEITDPTGMGPTVWFQHSPERSPGQPPPEQRWHPDLRVPPEVVEERIAAALTAGGRLVNDAFAPAFWVLADPDGNQMCLTTCQGRE